MAVLAMKVECQQQAGGHKDDAGGGLDDDAVR